HIDRLRPAPPTSIPGRPEATPPPPPDLQDGHFEYEVEALVASRWRRGRLEYLVHWRGYPIEERTWEPMRHLRRAKRLISAFHRLHSEAAKGPPTRRDAASQRGANVKTRMCATRLMGLGGSLDPFQAPPGESLTL